MLRHHEIESSACPCSSRLTQFSAGLSWTIPSGDNRVTPTNAPNTTEIKELNNEQQDIHYRNKVQIPAATIQLQNRTPWARLAPRQSLDNIDGTNRNGSSPLHMALHLSNQTQKNLRQTTQIQPNHLSSCSPRPHGHHKRVIRIHNLLHLQHPHLSTTKIVTV